MVCGIHAGHEVLFVAFGSDLVRGRESGLVRGRESENDLSVHLVIVNHAV